MAELKVVTWNLGFWLHKAEHNNAWEYLRSEIKPDLVLLQEVALVNLHNNEYLLFKPVHQNWGTALYTRSMPLQEVEIGGKCQNRMVAALIETPNKQKVIVVSIHAPIIRGRVFPYLAEIFDDIEKTVRGKTFIVGGDLNSARLAEKVWPGYGHGPFFEKLARSMFFDCHHKFHDKEEQTFFREGSNYPFQDDHLFVSYDLADSVKSCYVLNNENTRSLSDHIPLVSEINI